MLSQIESHVSMKIEYHRKIFEKYLKSNFMKIHPVGDEVVSFGRTDRWADMTQLVVACRNFANTRQNRDFSPATQQPLASEETLCFMDLANMHSRESCVLSGAVIQ
jgi:hypothetical protein